MSDFQFIRYEATPGEKYLGIATIKAYGKIVLKYKIIPNKDGSGYFPAAAAYKIPASQSNEEHYVSAFMVDSNSENEELINIIRANVKKAMANRGPSVFQETEKQAQAPTQIKYSSEPPPDPDPTYYDQNLPF